MRYMIPFDYAWYIYDCSLDAVLLVSNGGEIQCANPAACEMFQMTEEQLQLIGYMALVFKEDPRLKKLRQDILVNGKARAVLSLYKNDGTMFEGDCAFVKFRDYNGNQWTSISIREYIKSGMT